MAYKNIDDYIKETFPLEHEKILKRKKSDITVYTEQADAEFDEKLEAIIKGEGKEPKKKGKNGA